MGARDGSLEAALTYSNVVFSGSVLVWLMNAFASIIRGTGNMLVPSLAICVGVALLMPLSPLLIFGYGPIPALGIAGGGYAVVIGSALHRRWCSAATSLAAAAWSRFSLARLRRGPDAGHPSRRRRCSVCLAADQPDGVPDHRAGWRDRRPGSGRRLRHRRSAGISDDPAGLRLRRTAGRACRHQCRRRTAATRPARRADRRRHGVS